MISVFLCFLVLVSMLMPLAMLWAFRDYVEVSFSPEFDLAGRDGLPRRRIGGGSRVQADETFEEDTDYV